MKKIAICLIVLAATFTAACEGSTPQVQEQPADAIPEPAVEEPLQPEEQAEAAQPEPEQPAADPGTTAYSSPEGLFSIDAPASWSFSSELTLIEGSVVETFTSPDSHAAVQVVVDEVGKDMDKVLKGQVTLDFMKRLYGKDLRVATDVTLEDGREKLEWGSDEGEISGTTYFDRVDDHLYLFTVTYDDDYEEDYQQTLEDVAASFSAG